MIRQQEPRTWGQWLQGISHLDLSLAKVALVERNDSGDPCRFSSYFLKKTGPALLKDAVGSEVSGQDASVTRFLNEIGEHRDRYEAAFSKAKQEFSQQISRSGVISYQDAESFLTATRTERLELLKRRPSGWKAEVVVALNDLEKQVRGIQSSEELLRGALSDLVRSVKDLPCRETRIKTVAEVASKLEHIRAAQSGVCWGESYDREVAGAFHSALQGKLQEAKSAKLRANAAALVADYKQVIENLERLDPKTLALRQGRQEIDVHLGPEHANMLVNFVGKNLGALVSQLGSVMGRESVSDREIHNFYQAALLEYGRVDGVLQGVAQLIAPVSHCSVTMVDAFGVENRAPQPNIFASIVKELSHGGRSVNPYVTEAENILAPLKAGFVEIVKAFLAVPGITEGNLNEVMPKLRTDESEESGLSISEFASAVILAPLKRGEKYDGGQGAISDWVKEALHRVSQLRSSNDLN